MKRRLAFVIHHLNPWGGHDRSTLEIIKNVSRTIPVEIYSYTLDDPELARGATGAWGDFTFHRVRPHIRKPAFLLINAFFAGSGFMLGLLPRLRGEARPLVHATGASSWISDVIQVQFVQAAWEKKLRTLDPAFYRLPATRSGSLLRRKARGAYHRLLLEYNLRTEKRIYRRDKTYIAIAHCVSRELQEHFGIPAERVHVIHHGVDTQAFRPVDEESRADRDALRASLGILPGEIAIVFVGEYERKGLAASIQALARLPAEIRGKVRLVAIGGGDHRGFAELARGLGIEDRVLLVGHQKDVPRYYRACDLFLLPLYEPFGLVIIEAMASGLPMVVSRLAGGAELIEDGVSGKLLDHPSDPQAIAEALEAVLKDEARRTSMGREARKAAEKRTWDRVAKEYCSVLERLL